jgi:hypothetical protein
MVLIFKPTRFLSIACRLYTVTTKDGRWKYFKILKSLHDACLSPIAVTGVTAAGPNADKTVRLQLQQEMEQALTCIAIDGINFQASNQFAV